MIRLLVVFMMLHGTVFYGAGGALEHLFHQLEAGAANQTETGSAAHLHHHANHESPESPESHEEHDDPWINCVFCLDGVGGTGIELPQLFADFGDATTPMGEVLAARGNSVSNAFQARAPPACS